MGQRAVPARRRGSVLIWTGVGMAAVGGVAALAFDVSRLRSAKGELQAAAEAAAMYGANGLQDGTYLAKAQAAAAENKCLGTSVSLPAADVVAGNWSGSKFMANGLPRNALQVTAARTTSRGNPIKTFISSLIGKSAADVSASATIAVRKRSDYQWTGIDSASVTGGNAPFTLSSYDATDATAAATPLTIESNGAVSLAGPVRVSGDIHYGTSFSADSASKVTGNATRSSTSLTFPPGSVTANLAGAAATAQTYGDLNYSSFATNAGGTYIVRNVNFSNCTVNFTGPTTIIVTGNLNLTDASITTYGNMPANLKIIATGKSPTISISRLTQVLHADFYAPSADFTLDSPDKFYGISGRGVFKTMTIYGKGSDAPLQYDRSLASGPLSAQAMIVK